MNFKKLIMLAGLVLGLFAVSSKFPAAAQAPAPTTEPIKGKPLPGSFELPERFPGANHQVDLIVPEQAGSMGNWHRLVFRSHRDNSWEIYGANGFGQDQTNFTSGLNANESRPQLSLDATKIAFQASWGDNPEIYWMNWGGGGWVNVSNNPAYDYAPTWSPDGQRIAYVSDRDGNTEIYAAGLDGATQVRLTDSLLGDADPDWSPDGSQIAWVRYQDSVGALWVMSADGSNPHSVTNNCLYMAHPRWSPDGSKIALDCDADGDGWNELVLTDPTGTSWSTFYDPMQNLTDAWMGSWSGNGTVIVFSYVKYVVYDNQLYLESTLINRLYLSGGYPQTLVSSGYDLMPDWVSLDTLPPVSEVKSLPEYSRASGFKLYWSAEDQGVSGIYPYGAFDVQYRLGTGQWLSIMGDPSARTSGTQATFSSKVIDTAYFRSRAEDDAENWEAWPPGDGDTWTNLYVWRLNGTVKDARGYLVPNAQVNFSPQPWEETVQTGASGGYGVHAKTEGEYAVQASHAGYGNQDPRKFPLYQDTTQDIYLPPYDNVIRQGDFENGDSLISWISSGTLSVTLAAGYSGNQGAVLGKDCGGGPCLTAPEDIGEGNIYSFPAMDVDRWNNVHVVWNWLMYSMRNTDGTWTLPVALGNDNIPWPGQTADMRSALVVDKLGTVHVVIVGDDGLYYLQKLRGGNWTTEQLFASRGKYPALAMDDNGTLYVIYFSRVGQGGMFLAKRTLDGTWGEPLLISTSFDNVPPDVAVDSNHTVHIVYQTEYPDNDTYYTALLPDGTLTDPEKLMDGNMGGGGNTGGGASEIVVDSQGKIHIISDVNQNRIYVSRSPGEKWSRLNTITTDLLEYAHMSVDRVGGVHIIGNGCYYYYKSPDEVEFSEYRLPTSESICIDGAIDIGEDNLLRVTWPEDDQVNTENRRLTYRATALSAEYDEASLSQVVRIPNVNHPTLSVMHMIDNASSSFHISISETPSNTIVISPTSSTTWSHHWVDMTPWAGKTVTVTFALQQAENKPYAHLSIDDISLGGWLTPIIKQVSPRQVDLGVSATLVITGENFVATPIVRLNEITLTGVQYIDSTTLQVNLPGDLPRGIYTVWVINPQGHEFALPGALQVGRYLFLPITIRDPQTP